MGLDRGGQKHILGLWEGATENSVVCKLLLSDLVGRGLRADKPLLVVIDGFKALVAAIRDALDKCAVVQRCQVHKARNLLEHLPENARSWVKRKLDQAYNETDYVTAITAPMKKRKRLLSLSASVPCPLQAISQPFASRRLLASLDKVPHAVPSVAL